MGFAALSVVTRHVRDALQLVDIRVLDHLIVAGEHKFFG
jgi:DNA repair protein RadC